MLRAIWSAAEVPLGQWALSAEQWQHIAVAAQERGITLAMAMVIYRLTSLSFFGGLLLVLLGTALIKPTISSIISHFFVVGDRRRDSAFGLFFAAVYVGCILGTAVVGFLGERAGWHWGFAAAALGMLLSLTVYCWKQRDYLGDIGTAPVGSGNGLAALRQLTQPETDRIKVILWQGLFTALYAAAFFQAGGLLLLFVDAHLDRQLLGWTLPSTWLINVATISFVILTPCAIRLWSKLERSGRNPSAPTKLAWGLLVIGAAYLLLACLAAAVSSNDSSKVSWVWMAVVYLCFGIGDVLVWPNQIALTSRLAPRALSAVFIGGWYITIGIGTWMTGYIGALGYSWGLRPLFFTMSLTLLLLGAIAWWLTPRMLLLTHGLER
jgi:POT family proton-dependent oligopeptide transporter